MFKWLVKPFTMFNEFVDTHPSMSAVKSHLADTKVDVVRQEDGSVRVDYASAEHPDVRRTVFTSPVPAGVDVDGFLVGLAAGVSGARQDTIGMRRSTLKKFSAALKARHKEVVRAEKQAQKDAEVVEAQPLVEPVAATA